MKAIQIEFNNAESIADFVKIMRKYLFDARLIVGACKVDAKSVLGIFSLAAPGKILNLEIPSDAPDALIEELREFIPA